MKKLEKEGMEKAKNLVSNLVNNKDLKEFEKGLINAMKSGEDEFKKEHGRNMTYGEMRELYG